MTRLEVTVLDSRTRKPVTGLTANDFVIRVDGERQPVVSAAEVNVSSAEPTTASVVTEAAHDVSTNDVRATRLFVLIMHDGRGVAFHRNTAKGIAHRFIDQLGPDDLAAVLFVCDNGAAQDFTRDRLLLRQAIDQYEPSGCPLSALSVVRRTQQFLQAVPGYRRAILFVAQLLDEQDAYWDWDLQQIAFMSGFTHVPVYAFSARGLQAPMPDDLVRLHDRYRYDNHVELLRTLAGLTAGRATVLTNAPADAVPAIFEELDSYYAVAYEHQYPEDGRLRRIEVEVTRPDARVVLSRKLVRAPTGDGDARLPDEGRASGLIEAMGEPLPSGDVPLRLAILPVALPDAREQALALALMLPPASAAENYRVQLLVFDGEGRRRLLNQSLEISAPASRDGASGAGPEVALRLDLRPG